MEPERIEVESFHLLSEIMEERERERRYMGIIRICESKTERNEQELFENREIQYTGYNLVLKLQLHTEVVHFIVVV